MRIGWKTSITVITAVALGAVVGGVTVAKTAKPEYVLIPGSEAKFSPLDPKNPNGFQMAVLSGDPKTGPVAFELKIPKGAAPIHWHSSDYYALTIEGNTKHWLPGKEAEAKSNPPGTFWFQPGGASAPHGDECLSDGGCKAFIFMPGKFDFTPVADKMAPKMAPKK
jgi:hypothetical protein